MWRDVLIGLAFVVLLTPLLCPQSQLPEGSIKGSIFDPTGAVVAGAIVRLSKAGASAPQQSHSGDDGSFIFQNVSAGNYRLTVSATSFAPQTVSANLSAGQNLEIPHIMLALATTTTDVRVSETIEQVAEDQVKDQEQQRVLGVIPNFYVSYVPDAVALEPRQKFGLAWKSIIDPSAFVITGVIAGIEQATDTFNGYGQGAQGYAKRYGAAYADFVDGTILTGAVLPVIFKQDPRYFYKGTGSTKARIEYAMAMSVICKGDNGHWQANYSSIVGNLAAGGISNLYYPAADRNGAALTFENAAIGIAGSAAGNIIQEFLLPRLTPHKPGMNSAARTKQ